MPTLRLLPELEDALRQIPGVRAVSVVTGPDAAPTEVHVLASPGKPAKQLVRDVQSLALARYDIDIDHRIVSVVQIDDEPSGVNGGSPAVDRGAEGVAAPTVPDVVAAEPEEPARPAITAIAVRTSGPEAEAEVVLSFAGDTFRGAVTGPAAVNHRPRLVAQATLAALATLLGVPAEVDSATVLDAGGSSVALVVLTVTAPRLGPQSVSGSAVIRGDEADAVTRAVLDALNRRLTG